MTTTTTESTENIAVNEAPIEAVGLFHWRSYRLFVCTRFFLLLFCRLFAAVNTQLPLVLIILLICTTKVAVYENLGLALTCMINASAVYDDSHDAAEHTRRQQNTNCPSAKNLAHEELGYTGSLRYARAF